MLKGLDDAEIKKLQLKIFEMSIKYNDLKSHSKSTESAGVVTVMEAKGPKLITMLKSMVNYECLAEIKKKSAMVNQVISNKFYVFICIYLTIHKFRIVKMSKSNG